MKWENVFDSETWSGNFTVQRKLHADLRQHTSSSHRGGKTKNNLIWFRGLVHVNYVDDALKKTAKPTEEDGLRVG